MLKRGNTANLTTTKVDELTHKVTPLLDTLKEDCAQAKIIIKGVGEKKPRKSSDTKSPDGGATPTK